MFCPDCGKELADNAKFCAGCGFSLENAPEILPEKPVKKVKRKRVPAAPREYGKGHLAATIALCAILFLLIIAVCLVSVLRETFSEQSINRTVSQMDVGLLMEEFDVSDMLIDTLEDDVIDKYDIEPSTIRRILSKESVRNYVADGVIGYLDALIRGQRSYAISQDDVMRIIRRSAELIQEETGYRLDEQDYRDIEDYIRRNDVLEDYTLRSISSSAQINMEILRLPLLPGTYIVLIVLCSAVFAGIVILNIWRIRTALLGIGISISTAGLLLLLSGLSFYSLISVFTDGTASRALIEDLLSQTRFFAILIGLIILVAGIVFIASYFLVRKIQKPLRAAEIGL